MNMFMMYICAVFLSYVHTTFWLGTEHSSNRQQNLVPDKSGPRLAQYTYQKPAPKNGVDLWPRFLQCVSWVYNTKPQTEIQTQNIRQVLTTHRCTVHDFIFCYRFIFVKYILT